MARNPWHPIWYVAQSDGNTLSQAYRKGLIEGAATEPTEEKDDSTLADAELERHLGLPRAAGHWDSCISAVDPFQAKAITSNIELGENEAALCCVVVPFESREWECFLAVGTGQHLQPGTGVQSKGFVHIYRLLEDGKVLEFVHKVSIFDLSSM